MKRKQFVKKISRIYLGLIALINLPFAKTTKFSEIFAENDQQLPELQNQ